MAIEELTRIVSCYLLMGTPNDNREARVQKLREQAEQLRAQANATQNPKVRESMLNIAKSYENTAELLERILPSDDPSVP